VKGSHGTDLSQLSVAQLAATVWCFVLTGSKLYNPVLP